MYILRCNLAQLTLKRLFLTVTELRLDGPGSSICVPVVQSAPDSFIFFFISVPCQLLAQMQSGDTDLNVLLRLKVGRVRHKMEMIPRNITQECCYMI